MHASTEKLSLPGPAGALEVVRERPAQGTARPAGGVAVLAHPHPLHGGTMDNKVVQTLARACLQCGWTAVRFNFRGVGASAGGYDAGHGELEDLLAVVAQCAPQGPLVLGGFSFGAFVASHAARALQATRQVHGVLLVGTAAGRFKVAELAPELRERSLVIHGERDDTVVLADVLDWARPQNLPVTVVPGASHFFHGQLVLLRGLVVRHLNALS